ncbi:MAG: hypothetical protein M3Z37_11215 [Candidatus Eremiobacteraeota bacterium]|nr:hypothetical protein [Candidatus Eremiobacteraeota bacterium]
MMESMTDLNPNYTNGPSGSREDRSGDGDMKRTLLAGLLGAVVASAGYLIYSRLEEDQKHALRQSVGKFVEDKISDVRSQLKF